MQYKQNTGFTMIELMVVVVIMGILAAIGIPSFQTMIKNNNIEAYQSNLSSAIATARSEAASRNVTVSICNSLDQVACVTTASTNWTAGWIVFTDRGVNGVIDGTDETIASYKNSRTAYRLSVSSGLKNLTFNTQGFLVGGADTTFTVCKPGADATVEAAFARGLFVSKSGLVMKKNSGLACPS